MEFLSTELSNIVAFIGQRDASLIVKACSSLGTDGIINIFFKFDFYLINRQLTYWNHLFKNQGPNFEHRPKYSFN